LSCIVVLAALLVSANARAFDVKTTASGVPVHWERAEVTYEIDPSIAAAVPGGYDAVAEAVAGWSGIPGAPKLSVTAGDGHAKPGNDGHNVVFFAPDGYAPAGDALAITILSYDETTGEIVDADIVVNGKHAFGILADGARPSANARPMSNDGSSDEAQSAGTFDLVHVVAHETGHTLGLRDDLTPGPLMYLYTMPGDASARTPTADDEAGVDSLYASSAAGHAGCQARIAAGPMGSGLSSGLVAMLLAVVAWSARRRTASAPAP
jgi:hypothetical protein